MGRSPGFGSTPRDFVRPIRTRFRYGFSHSAGLTLPRIVTRRLIKQKARRHTSQSANSARETENPNYQIPTEKFIRIFGFGFWIWDFQFMNEVRGPV
jgi:hypothetical protein